MLRYFSKKPKVSPPSIQPPNPPPLPQDHDQPIPPPIPEDHDQSISPPITQIRELTDDDDIIEKWAYLEMDPSKRKQILDYHPNVQDEVRRAYLLNGPNQIRLTKYPVTKISGKNRSFCASWFEEYNWLEYSVRNNAVYCFPCYLFYNESSTFGIKKRTAFVKDGFNIWNQKKKLKVHQGTTPTSHHNNCVRLCEALMNQKQSIESSYKKYTTQEKEYYLVRLKASLEAVKYLVRGGLAFRAHDEGKNSVYKGHFLEFVDVVVVRFVDGRGFILERFVGIVHVADTSAKALLEALETLLYGLGLCMSKIRGQGYDGASNMRGHLGGLKTLIQKENPQAYYVHCFAHQLRLARLARLYPTDFDDVDNVELSSQLDNYIRSVKDDDRFSNLKGLSDLSKTLVQTKKNKAYRFVYRLVKLALTLPVATATVERVFSGMKYVKDELRNRMSNPWLNDCLVTFVEKDVFSTVNDLDIIKRFQAMRKRKMQLDLD